ncbi:MAG: HAMP domain-containing sensor histidine kinase, partial [Marinoscillum sp.]
AVLENQKKALETLNQTKDRFFSIISHDLRGPINSFHGVSNLIKYFVESKNPEELLEVADDIDQSVDRLTNLLDNLLSWAMQQQGHFPNVPEKLNLNEMSQELVETLDNMARGKQIELDARIDEQIYLWADRNTTMTILRNLVNNGLKFTEPGGKVGLTAVQDGSYAIINIYDTGVGMPKDKLKKLWRLQEEKSTYGTAGERGLGLGLQLVYEFIEMNHGKVEVESTEQIGTTFTVWLPLFEKMQSEKVS